MLQNYKKYYYKQQKRDYSKNRNILSMDDKYKLLEDIINGNIFDYYGLMNELIFDLAEDTTKYFQYIEKIIIKIKEDLVAGDFIYTLEKIGKYKKNISYKVYTHMHNSKINSLVKIYSGFILGGYYKDNSKDYEKQLVFSDDIIDIKSNLRTIMVIYNYNISQRIKNYLNKVYNITNIEIKLEFINLCIYLYDKDNIYFINKIKLLTKENNNKLNWLIFNRISFMKKIKIKSKDFFDLVEIVINSNIYVIDEILICFKRYSKQYKKILDFIIYQIIKNNNFLHDSKNVDWILKDISTNNNNYIVYLLKRFNNFKTKTPNIDISRLIYNRLFKSIFINLKDYGISNIKNAYDKKLIDYDLYIKFCNEIVSMLNTHKDINLVYKLFNDLLFVIKKRLFLNKSINEYKNNIVKIYNKYNNYKDSEQNKHKINNVYNELIYLLKDILDQLTSRNSIYDENKLKDNLKSYNSEELEKIIWPIVENKLKYKIYSPLLWILDKLKEKDYSKFVICYLNELDIFLKNINKLKIDKITTSKYIKKLKIKLSKENESQFWEFLSEIILINKLNKFVTSLDAKLPQNKKNFDLKCNMNKKNMWFEIKTPQMDKRLALSTGVVAIKDRTKNIIYNQGIKKLIPNKKYILKNNDLFFIVINISYSTIDNYFMQNIFSGSDAYTFFKDKLGNIKDKGQIIKIKDRLIDLYPEKDIKLISGIIYYKNDINFINNKYRIKLIGDIIPNPIAKNKMNKKDYVKLKKIIFI